MEQSLSDFYASASAKIQLLESIHERIESMEAKPSTTFTQIFSSFETVVSKAFQYDASFYEPQLHLSKTIVQSYETLFSLYHKHIIAKAGNYYDETIKEKLPGHHDYYTEVAAIQTSLKDYYIECFARGPEISAEILTQLISHDRYFNVYIRGLELRETELERYNNRVRKQKLAVSILGYGALACSVVGSTVAVLKLSNDKREERVTIPIQTIKDTSSNLPTPKIPIKDSTKNLSQSRRLSLINALNKFKAQMNIEKMNKALWKITFHSDYYHLSRLSVRTDRLRFSKDQKLYSSAYFSHAWG